MAMRTEATFIQANAHPAENVRLALGGIFGVDAGAFSGGVGALDPGHGLQRPGALAVSENGGTPDMSVDVAAGGAWIRGTESASQGCYHVYNDATENVAVATSDVNNPRIDLVVVRVADDSYSGSDNQATLEVVTGTPGSSPSVPAVPDNALVLARIDVAANVSSITDAAITPVATLARPWNTAWGVLAVGVDTSERTNRTTSADIASGVSVAVNVPAGRRVVVRAQVSAEQNSSAGLVRLFVYKNGSSLQIVGRETVAAGSNASLSGAAYDTTSGGSVTYSLRMNSSAGTVDARGDGMPTQIIVEDAGPA